MLLNGIEKNCLSRWGRLSFMAIIFAAVLGALIVAPAVYAVPAVPASRTVTLANGAKAEVYLKGDEFLHWNEDGSGYAIVQDGIAQAWVYAEYIGEGEFRATKYLLGQSDPVEVGLTRLDYSQLRAYALQVAQERELASSATRAPTTGTMQNLVVLVNFSDLKISTDIPNATTAFDALFNQEGYSADGAAGSVKDYYHEVSYDQLTVQSTIAGPVTLNNGYAYYDIDPRWMVTEALAKLNASGFDFTTVDGDSDGWVDGLTIIHAGGGEEYGGNDPDYIWSHKWQLASPVTYDGVSMQVYHTEPARRGWDGYPSTQGITRIGVICHENGHFLGLPDLYDRDGTSVGVGEYCLMSGGSWNGADYGECPSHMSAWCKTELGWVTPTVVSTAGTYAVTQGATAQSIFKLQGLFSSDEYFLIENRQGVGFDAYLPGTERGILVWHVDESQAGYQNDNELHYMVDLEEAEGPQDFEESPYGAGADTDYFRGGYKDSFTATTTPNNFSYSNSPLGLEVTDIGYSGASMLFTVTTPESYTLTVESAPSSGITITGTAGGITPYATTAYDGLPVTLTAPSFAGGLSFIQWRSTAGTPLSASRTYTFSITDDTTVVAEYGERFATNALFGWGHNAWGQIGDNSAINRFSPVHVRDIIDPVKVVGGQYHSLALDPSGFVYSWGSNADGQLGYSETTPAVLTQEVPAPVPGLANVIDIAAGARHSLAVVDADDDGKGVVYAWGLNTSGQLGDGTMVATGDLVQVIDPNDPTGFLQDVVAVAAGEYHSVALKDDGTVVAWGANAMGQLGDNRVTWLGLEVVGGVVSSLNSYFSADRPVTVVTSSGDPLGGIVEISCGNVHTLARDADGNVWSWGGGWWGQLGHGSNSDGWYAAQVTGVTNVTQVAAGCWHSLICTESGTLQAWGANWWGQLGDGMYLDANVPVAVTGLRDSVVVKVSAGENHSVALLDTGTLVSWGRNRHGQLGIGVTNDILIPTALPGITEVSDLGDSGAWHSFAIAEAPFYPPVITRQYGLLHSAGLNDNGQLGLGDNDDRHVFTPQPDMDSVAQMDAGFSHVVILDRNGHVWTAGDNQWGQLGLGDTTARNTFALATFTGLAEQPRVVAVDAGESHTVVLDEDGQVWVCGRNNYGQLGLGNSGEGTEQARFTLVAGISRIVAISAGGHHTLARSDSGVLWAVGRNGRGQLGLGDRDDRHIFTVVSGVSYISSILAGPSSSMLLMSNGTVMACGYNVSGKLGMQDDDVDKILFTTVPGLANITAVSLGGQHALALDSAGNLWSAGYGGDGANGLGGLTVPNEFVQVPGIENVAKIVASCGGHSLVVDDDEILWATGRNNYGQLGLDDTTTRSFFTQVSGVSDCIAVAAGEDFSLIEARSPASWTFMVYMDADNNLEPYAIGDFLEMAQIGSTSDVNIVAMLDRIEDYDSRYDDWTNTRRGLIAQGDTPSSTWGESVGEANMGSATTVSEFVNWSMDNYPAENYAVIFWNHGDGWYDAVASFLGRSAEAAQRDMLATQIKGDASGSTNSLGLNEFISRAVCWDESDGYDALSLSELSASLTTVEGGGRQVNLIGFDACLMGMAEVAYDLREHGDVMVGSEETEPGYGWAYHLFLDDLVADPEMTSAELGTAIVDAYYEYYGGYTLSAIDLSRMDALGAAISELADAMSEYWATDKIPVRVAAQAVLDELDLAIIRNRSGLLYPKAYGLAIYMPWGSYAFDSSYDETTLEFATDTTWDEFLPTFFAESRLGWVGKARYLAQEFSEVHHVDLYDFCDRLLISTDPDTRYTESSIPHVFSSGGTAISLGGDVDSISVAASIPFAFPFYGQNRYTLWISDDGVIDFSGATSPLFYNTIRELIENPRIAPMWTDLCVSDIYVNTSGSAVVIRWEGWQWPDGYLWSVPITVNLQAILYSDGRIQFNYGDNPEPIYSWLGQPPTIGISAGDGVNYNLSVFDQAMDRDGVASILWTPVEPLDEPQLGTLYSTGLNDSGQLGLGDTTDRDVFTEQPNRNNIVQLDCGDKHAVLLDADGNVWTAGNNDYGQLGQGNTTSLSAFTQVEDLSNIVAVDAGSWHTVALDADGHVWVCGRNAWPCLGLGSVGGQRTSFVQVPGLDRVTAISAGGAHTLVVRDDVTLWAVGRNDHGQLGLGDTSEPVVFTRVTDISGVRAISAGVYSSMVLQGDNTVVACGLNDYGQLGLGSTDDTLSFTAVPGLSGITAISSGYWHSLALDSSGTIWATGRGDYGATGFDDMAHRDLYEQVPGISNVTNIFASGGSHSLAIDGDGTLWTTGDNDYGQLGLADTTNRTSFTQVTDIIDCMAISAGEDFSLALVVTAEEEEDEGDEPAAVSGDETPTFDEEDEDETDAGQVVLTPAERGVDEMGVIEPTWPDDDTSDSSEVILQTIPVSSDNGTSATGSTLSDADVSASNDGIVDNRDDTQAKKFHVVSGDWRISTRVDGFYDRDYCYARAREGVETCRAQFVCGSLPAGTYDVYAWWPSRKDRATSVAYEIYHADGVAEVRVDQTVGGGAWNKLGTYSFEAGSHVVEIHNGASGTDGFVCADAVNFVPRVTGITLSSPVPTTSVDDRYSSAITMAASTEPVAVSSSGISELILKNFSEPGILVTPGARVLVEWTSSNLPSYTPIAVSLYRDGEKAQTLMAATPNDGDFLWTVDPALRGDGYTLRVSVVGAEDTFFSESAYSFIIGLPEEW